MATGKSRLITQEQAVWKLRCSTRSILSLTGDDALNMLSRREFYCSTITEGNLILNLERTFDDDAEPEQ